MSSTCHKLLVRLCCATLYKGKYVGTLVFGLGGCDGSCICCDARDGGEVRQTHGCRDGWTVTK